MRGSAVSAAAPMLLSAPLGTPCRPLKNGGRSNAAIAPRRSSFSISRLTISMVATRDLSVCPIKVRSHKAVHRKDLFLHLCHCRGSAPRGRWRLLPARSKTSKRRKLRCWQLGLHAFGRALPAAQLPTLETRKRDQRAAVQYSRTAVPESRQREIGDGAFPSRGG